MVTRTDMLMKCDGCGELGRWLGADTRWTPVHGASDAVRSLYECNSCGHRQLSR